MFISFIDVYAYTETQTAAELTCRFCTESLIICEISFCTRTSVLRLNFPDDRILMHHSNLHSFQMCCVKAEFLVLNHWVMRHSQPVGMITSHTFQKQREQQPQDVRYLNMLAVDNKYGRTFNCM